jgi:hypothetical protein
MVEREGDRLVFRGGSAPGRSAPPSPPQAERPAPPAQPSGHGMQDLQRGASAPPSRPPSRPGFAGDFNPERDFEPGSVSAEFSLPRPGSPPVPDPDPPCKETETRRIALEPDPFGSGEQRPRDVEHFPSAPSRARSADLDRTGVAGTRAPSPDLLQRRPAPPAPPDPARSPQPPGRTPPNPPPNPGSSGGQPFSPLRSPRPGDPRR